MARVKKRMRSRIRKRPRSLKNLLIHQINSQDSEGDNGSAEETLLPEVNFPTFIMSLNASALFNLGIIEDPATGQSAKNLPMAKQTIDILSMLEEKTRGNLTKDEAEILKNILYDLRIAYVRERE